MIDECGLPDAGPGNDGNHVYQLVGPSSIRSRIFFDVKGT